MKIDKIELVLENVEYGNGDVWWRVNKLYKYNKTFFTYHFNNDRLYKVFFKDVNINNRKCFITTLGMQKHTVVTVQDAVLDYNIKLVLNMDDVELPTKLTIERKDLKFEPYCEIKDDDLLYMI